VKTKQLALIVVTLLLIVGGVQGQIRSRSESMPWKQYTIAGEDFSVALPILPALHLSQEYLDQMEKPRRVYSVGAYAEGVVYVIYVVENPDSQQSLDDFVAARARSKTDFTDVNLDEFLGKKFSDVDSMLQFFATKDRLFEFWAAGAPLDDPRMTTFFSSLSLHTRKGSIKINEGPGLPYEPRTDAGNSSGIFTGKEVNKKVRLAMKPEPSYTELARTKGVTGTVILKCVFASNGSVTNISVVSPLPDGLTEKSIDAAKKIKFIPAVKDGKFVSMWIQLEYNFNLY
jgi:TonB family protein